MVFVRKTPPSAGQVVDFEQLVRGILPFYGQTEHLESTFYSNKDSWWRAGQPRTEKN